VIHLLLLHFVAHLYIGA